MGHEEQGVCGAARYVLIPRTLVFLFRGREVLLLRGSPGKRIWANRYNGLGGHIERGETPREGALRELREETGLTGIPLCLAAVITVDVEPDQGVLVFVFRGEVTGEVALRPSAEGGLAWIPLDGLSALPLVSDLEVILPRLWPWTPARAPLLARSWYDAGEEFHIAFE